MIPGWALNFPAIRSARRQRPARSRSPSCAATMGLWGRSRSIMPPRSTATAGQDYQAISGTLEFQENETVKSLTVPILRPPPTGATKSFRVTLSNPTGGATLATATTTVNILENYPTLTPPLDARLAIRREGGVNVLTWTGGGQLQRADRVTGPWQTLADARSPWPVQSPVPVTFYRVKGTRPVNLYVPSSLRRPDAAALGDPAARVHCKRRLGGRLHEVPTSGRRHGAFSTATPTARWTVGASVSGTPLMLLAISGTRALMMSGYLRGRDRGDCESALPWTESGST